MCLIPFNKTWAYDLELWQQVLAQHVNGDGLVDYAGIKAHPEPLDKFVESLKNFGPHTYPDKFRSDASRLAYWINTYNALVLYGIKNAYPVTSVTDILPDFGFFKSHTYFVDGKRYTLDNIEHDMIRAEFADPRIHAALNCGAMSCPRLFAEPFSPQRLETQLQASMEKMVRTPRHVRLDLGAKTLYLSSIFNWFKADFLNWLEDRKEVERPTLTRYIGLFQTDEMRLTLESIGDPSIVFLDYDWGLNTQAVTD